ncbi:FliH/SctL family protein [Tabrizicola fusiformis]|uniref:flagellar biosynthesis protein n=1 Tax=Tabrizicola sp. SY72 TaxID=2741673 RepID=UPI001573889E|nr:flagellar biosynthesis protein [Tabrizicola sp. SY72]NTT86660.1 flagellar biosynthesis protein [Tabrizicola sp. SY72]
MALRLEVFETAAETDRPDVLVTDTGHLEEAKLASFEAGYSAGWEDAAAALSEEQNRIRADLARNLQGLAFTYHEARDHVLRALEPLLKEMVARLLPTLARETLGQLVVETLRPMAAERAGAPLTLVINPVSRRAVELVLAENAGLPLEIEEEPSLGEGQAYLRFATSETRIDLDRAITEIIAAVRDFFALSRKEAPNG